MKEISTVLQTSPGLAGFTDRAEYLGLTLPALLSESIHPLTSYPHHPSFHFLNMLLETFNFKPWNLDTTFTYTRTHTQIQTHRAHIWAHIHSQAHTKTWNQHITLPMHTHHTYMHILSLCLITWIVPFLPAWRPCWSLFYSCFSLVLKTHLWPNVPLQLYSYVLLTLLSHHKIT